ncbi:hypothetical protein KAU11_11650 [Candidatus Babeliales bacterium]|nr:hypothetical protein [Candidatus Babeliales bacterium]
MTREELRTKYQDEVILSAEEKTTIKEVIENKGQIDLTHAEKLMDAISFLQYELSMRVYAYEMIKQDYAMLRTRIGLSLQQGDKTDAEAGEFYNKEALEIDLIIQDKLNALTSQEENNAENTTEGAPKSGNAVTDDLDAVEIEVTKTVIEEEPQAQEATPSA